MNDWTCIFEWLDAMGCHGGSVVVVAHLHVCSCAVTFVAKYIVLSSRHLYASSKPRRMSSKICMVWLDIRIRTIIICKNKI